jgi:pimeloyl-ACP methyl ester carboxylesterase
MEKACELELSPGCRTVVILDAPERGADQRVALLCHGFLSSKQSDTNRALTERLLPMGITVCRFDLFGHGESGGPFRDLTLTRCLRQTDGLIQWLKQNGYTDIGLAGSSFGGLVAIHTAAAHPELARLALKCPVSNYPVLWEERLGEWGMKVWKTLGILPWIGDGKKFLLGYGFYQDLFRHDTDRAAARIESPTLIVHGERDEYVPFEQSERLYGRLRLLEARKALKLLPDADHEFTRDEDFETMIRHITSWLAE